MLLSEHTDTHTHTADRPHHPATKAAGNKCITLCISGLLRSLRLAESEM